MLPLPHTVTLYPSIDGDDPDGNLVRRPTASGTPSPAWVQSCHSTEDTGQAVNAARAVVFLPPAAPALDAWAQLDFDGARWELVGAAAAHDDAQGVRVYWRADVRQVT